ncbi:hypothetical protein [Desulfosporosinus sp. SB140]|uniref:hypothetical protein n=1 Tax=Desulfosporosinus paludis TaxID=3115649 RepID=UPI00388DA533
MPFYLDWILKLSPFLVGLIMTVVSLAMFIMSPFSGSLADRMGAKLSSKPKYSLFMLALKE